MLRCATLVLALTLPAAAAVAQVPRNFPAQALRGELHIAQPPEAVLNGQSARLAPGARIRDENNMLQVSGALAGRTLLVHYTLDTLGLLREIWVLTPAERARQPWPVTEAEARAWAFDPLAQTWRRP